MLRDQKAVPTTIRRVCKTGFGFVLLATPLARGAELITLRSGFTITCTSREAISAGTMRLYLPGKPAASANYMDVPESSVAAVDIEPVSHLDKVAPLPSVPSSELGGILQQYGAAHNVSVALLASIIQAESAGNPQAVSRASARGLMQLMPGTAAQLHVKHSFEQGENVSGGSAYLDGLLTRYHENIALALAAYNAGPGAVDRYHGIPPFHETRLYVARVLKEFNRRVRQEAAARASGAIAEATNPAGMSADR